MYERRSDEESSDSGGHDLLDAASIDLPGVESLLASSSGQVAAVPFVQLLARTDPQKLPTDYDVLELVAAWDKVAAWVSQQQLAAIAEFARRPMALGIDPDIALASRSRPGEVARSHPDDEIAARLTTSRAAASHRLDLSLTLAAALPQTRAALSQGRIDLAKAEAIARACQVLEPEAARALESKVLDRAERLNPPRLRQLLRREVVRLDPAAAEARCQRARSERRVVITPMEDGMAELYAVLSATDAVAIDTALTAAARHAKANRCDGDDRTMDQLRADLLAEPFLEALANGELRGPRPTPLARHRGAPARLHVTVSASVLLGDSDEPGHLERYGPITAATARAMAVDATWRRILTDPVSGQVVDVGTTVYRPPAVLERFVETRDGTCRYPGCNWPASASDSDHVVPFPDGPTAADNLASLCRRHHRFKHQGSIHPDHSLDKRLQQAFPGRLVWTMPTGHTYRVDAPSLDPQII